MLTRGDDPKEVIEAMSRALMNKYLHEPSHALNQAVAEERDHLCHTVSRLYNLHEE